MYYLQSRYYDPEVCRFINADGFASTGQGFLGYNMFAYCVNNPILYYDSSGEKPRVAIFKGHHNKVRDEVAEEFGYYREVYVKNGTKRGFLDLYDASTGCFYEIKHEVISLDWHNSQQRNKYMGATVEDRRFKGLELGQVVPGTQYTEGVIYCDDYNIIYHTSHNPLTPELIVYRIDEKPENRTSNVNNQDVALGAFTAMGMLGTMGMAGWFGSPTPGSRNPILNVIK